MVRAQEHEKFSDPVILQGVIDSLENENPITKKEACSRLNISYNTARLGKIIEDFKDSTARQKKRRQELRTAPVTDADKKDIISSYLAGDSLTSISDMTFRSIIVIKNVLQTYNIPLRDASANYTNPVFLTDSSTANDYKEGDLVYSAKYDIPAYIRKLVEPGVYSMWTTGDYRKQIVQPYYELADLRELQTKFNINIKGLDTAEYNRIIVEARNNAKKRSKK
ncbi:MAG: hypothetical protein DRN17_05020 [Thermoplasmata archaeon]|nr:MAG: hypothetical protein DRN17_05020 [Thermoplasmata archaeon]